MATVSSTVSANWQKAAPGSNFGTRALAFYSVTLSGVHTGYTASGSAFAKAIRGVQTVAEVYFIGTPASNAFVVAVAADTDNGQTSSNANDQTMQAAIDAATGGSSTVAALTASGASIA